MYESPYLVESPMVYAIPAHMSVVYIFYPISMWIISYYHYLRTNNSYHMELPSHQATFCGADSLCPSMGILMKISRYFGRWMYIFLEDHGHDLWSPHSLYFIII